MIMYQIIVYATKNKKEPFTEWRQGLDKSIQPIVMARLHRLTLGNLGDAKALKGASGIWELRISYGPGYRIYFGKQYNKFIILLIGGDKSDQERDILKAKKYWLDYKEQS